MHSLYKWQEEKEINLEWTVHLKVIHSSYHFKVVMSIIMVVYSGWEAMTICCLASLLFSKGVCKHADKLSLCSSSPEKQLMVCLENRLQAWPAKNYGTKSLSTWQTCFEGCSDIYAIRFERTFLLLALLLLLSHLRWTGWEIWLSSIHLIFRMHYSSHWREPWRANRNILLQGS